MWLDNSKLSRRIIVVQVKLYIDGFVQDCSISSVLAMELLQSCSEPSIFGWYKNKTWSVFYESFTKSNFEILEICFIYFFSHLLRYSVILHYYILEASLAYPQHITNNQGHQSPSITQMINSNQPKYKIT